MILPRAAAKNYHGRGLFQWSLNVEHPLDLLQVVVETMCLDTWCCRDLCFVSVWLLQVHYGAFPFQRRVCFQLCPRDVTKRPCAKAVWGSIWGKKWMVMRLSCWAQERKKSYGHKECRLCLVAKYSHIQHIGMQGELGIDTQRSSSKEGCSTLVEGHLGIRQRHLNLALCHLWGYSPSMWITSYMVWKWHGSIAAKMHKMKQASEMTQLCNIVRVILDW